MIDPGMRPAMAACGWQSAATKQRVLSYAVGATFILMTAYVCARLMTLFVTGYSLADATMAAMLLAAELFVTLQGVGYFASMIKATKRDAVMGPTAFARHADAPVAVLVTSFNESEEVLEQTLASVRAMDYPAIRLYLVDDSTREGPRRGAERVAKKYDAQLVHRTNRAGYKAGAINDLLPDLHPEYVAVLDADQRPTQSWLKEIIPMLEENRRLAFVQVPQVYVNTEGLPVAEAAAYQQAVFFEYICEGKSHSNAMFCCGSNVVLRRTALLSIEVIVDGRCHFFDETSVTEDFSTSVRLHARSWETAYVNHPYVVGMGPETLAAYFTQQMRWAMGTLGVGLRVLRQLFTTPRQLRPQQWWEYVLSGTYYFVGFANLVFMAAPVMFLMFGVTPVRTDSDLYLAFFVPYAFFNMNLFFFGMKLRRYSIRGIWLASALSFATFWIYMKASLVALFGLKRAFGVTPKAVGGAVPVKRMLPEFVAFTLNAAAASVGLAHLFFVGFEVAYVMTTIWATYHALLLSMLFLYFNRSVSIPTRRLMFERVGVAA